MRVELLQTHSQPEYFPGSLNLILTLCMFMCRRLSICLHSSWTGSCYLA